MSFLEVKHQDRAIEMLQLGVRGGRLAHAHIFFGPEGIGKSTTASQLARLLLCEQPRTIEQAESSSEWRDSCGQCTSCRLFDAGTHPDYHLIYKELISFLPGKERHKATAIGIDVIRAELIEKVGRRPGLGSVKVFVILEAHRLTRSAQNALLKTLEEPPGDTHIVLIARQLSSLLATIRSRAGAIRFDLLPDEFVRERLGQAGATEAQQQFLSRFVPGQLGLALELFDLGVYDLSIRMGKELCGLSGSAADDLAQLAVTEAKALAEKMIERVEQAGRAKASESELNRLALKRVLSVVAAYYHDALKRKLGLDGDRITHVGQLELVDQLAGQFDIDRLQENIEHVKDACRHLDANVNQNLLAARLFALLAC